MSVSIAIAEKHVKLSTRVKHIAESKGYAGQVYIATHKPQTYRHAEQDSGKDFWSIKAWMPSSPKDLSLKDPDLIITDRDRVKFFVEVKWGTVSETYTDLKLGRKEEEKIKRLLAAQSVYCNVNGPVSEPAILRQHKKFWIDEQTQFVLVTDLSAYQGPQSFLDLWAEIGFRVTDSEKQVGRFPSLQEVLKEKK
jgi:hypothetical protein